MSDVDEYVEYDDDDFDDDDDPIRTFSWRGVRAIVWDNVYNRVHLILALAAWVSIFTTVPRVIGQSWAYGLAAVLSVVVQHVISHAVDTVERWDREQPALDEQARRER